MRSFGKVLVGSALALTMVAGDAASARGWGHGGGRGYGHGGYRHYNGRSNFGDFLLGVGVIGVIAAVASSNSRDRDREVRTTRDDPPPAPRDEFPFDLDESPVPPPPARGQSASLGRDDAVDACKVAAEREGERYSSRVHVGTIEDVQVQKDGGYRVTGIADIDKGGYNGGKASTERARFDCTAAGGRIVSFRFGSSAELAQRY